MDDRKKNKKRQGGLPTQMGLVFRMAAGAYLLYLAYSIYSGAGNVTGVERGAFIAAITVFAIVGAIVVISSLRAMQRGEYEGGEGDYRKEIEKEKEEISEIKRIRFGEKEEE